MSRMTLASDITDRSSYKIRNAVRKRAGKHTAIHFYKRRSRDFFFGNMRPNSFFFCASNGFFFFFPNKIRKRQAKFSFSHGGGTCAKKRQQWPVGRQIIRFGKIKSSSDGTNWPALS